MGPRRRLLFQVPFFPPASSKIRSQHVGLGDSSAEFCPRVAGCGRRNSKGLNTGTLGRELGLLVLLPRTWRGRKHRREVTAPNVSHAPTRCAGTGSVAGLQGHKGHLLLQRCRYLPAALFTCLSSLHSALFGEYLLRVRRAQVAGTHSTQDGAAPGKLTF